MRGYLLLLVLGVLVACFALFCLRNETETNHMIFTPLSLHEFQVENADLWKTKDNLTEIQQMGVLWEHNYDAQRPGCKRYLPTFHPENWNMNEMEMQYNNCYAYAFRDRDLNRQRKPQPGEKAGLPEVPAEEYNCARLWEQTQADHPTIQKWNDSTPCPCGSYKAFMVLDTDMPNTDFHYLRQDDTGFWSQKLGSGPATRLDASGHFITNPRTANLNYGTYNYKVRCGSFCIPTEKQDVD